jgi:hypothetical protein
VKDFKGPGKESKSTERKRSFVARSVQTTFKSFFLYLWNFLRFWTGSIETLLWVSSTGKVWNFSLFQTIPARPLPYSTSATLSAINSLVNYWPASVGDPVPF